MRVSINITSDIEKIVKSYSEIKQCFSSSTTIQQFEDNHILEYHLHNIEEKLLNIRAEATAVQAQINAELPAKRPDNTVNATENSVSKPLQRSSAEPQKLSSYKPSINVSEYRIDIFSQPEPEVSAEDQIAGKKTDDDFQYQLKYYRQKCAEVKAQGKLLEQRLWISFPITVCCIFLYIFLTSINARNLHKVSVSFAVYHYLVPFIMVFGPLAYILKYYLGKAWKWYKFMKNEKRELEETLKTNQHKLQEVVSNDDKKYIDNILSKFDDQFEAVKVGAWKGLWLWLLFNIGNFLIIAATIKYSQKDSKILLICIIWLILTTGWFLLPSLCAWLKLKHEKQALEYRKTSPSATDPEIALLSTDELAERMDIVCKKRAVFLVLYIVFAIVAAITLPAIILLINHGKQLADHGAIVFYIVIALNYAMGIISFLCFNKYRKEYKRLQRR